MGSTKAFDTPDGRVTYEVEVRPHEVGLMKYLVASRGRLTPVDGGEPMDLGDEDLRRLRNRYEH
jgi:hypothetical protein